jgi:uncharacterized DUF497 family protein
MGASRSCGSPRLLRPVTRCRTHAAASRYKENDFVVRILYARKATRKEVRFYEEGI